MSGGMNHSARCFAPGSAGILPALAVGGADAPRTGASFAFHPQAGKMPALPGMVAAAAKKISRPLACLAGTISSIP